MAFTATISGNTYNIADNSFSIDARVDERSRCRFVIEDLAGTLHFAKGQPVVVTDSTLGIRFTGEIASSTEVAIVQRLEHSIDCVDVQDIPGRRTSNDVYTNQYAGVMVAKQHQSYLSAEGITASYALDQDTLQGDFAAGTLSNTVSTAPNTSATTYVGTTVTVAEDTQAEFATGTLTAVSATSRNTLEPTGLSALKLSAVCTGGGASSHTYRQWWSGSQAVGASGYYIRYSIWLHPSNPQAQMAMDITFSSGLPWRDSFVYSDQNGLSPHPNTDIGTQANGKWYTRLFRFDNYSARTITRIDFVSEGNNSGNYYGWLRDVQLLDSSQNVLVTFTKNTNTQQDLSNYSATWIDDVTVYNLATYAGSGTAATNERISPSYSLASAVTGATSKVAWVVSEPFGTKFVLRSSVNGGSSYQDCTQQSSIPSLSLPASVTSTSIILRAQFFWSNTSAPLSPEYCPSVELLWSQVTPQANAAPSVAAQDGYLELARSTGSFQTTYSDAFAFTDMALGRAKRDTDGSIILNSTPAIRYQAESAIPGSGNSFMYVKIWEGSYTIPPSGLFPVLEYEMWIAGDSQEIRAAIDYNCSDGTTLRDSVLLDEMHMSAHPNTDLAGLATNTWYYRRFVIGTAHAGKTITQITVGFEGDGVGQYTAYFRNARIRDWTGVTLLDIFYRRVALPIIPQNINSNGYTNMVCDVVTAYDQSYPIQGSNYANFYQSSIDGIYQSSMIAWQQDEPEGTLIDHKICPDRLNSLSTAFLDYENNSAIPGLVAGQIMTGTTPQLSFFSRMYITGDHPTVTPRLRSLTLTYTTAYQSSKTDFRQVIKQTADYTAGTVTNLSTSITSNVLQMDGYQRTWNANTYNNNQTLYGSSAPGDGVKATQYFMETDSGTDVRSRFDFAGNAWQDFTVEIDVKLVAANTQAGLVYRTANWFNNNDTYAYTCVISTAEVLLARGSHSSTGSFNVLPSGSYATTLSTNQWYRIRLVVAGSSHTVFLNGVQIITSTDGTYTAAGYVGARFYNNTGSRQTGYFDNFGILKSLTGSWVSPAYNISAAGTSILGSLVRVQRQGDPVTSEFTQTSMLLEISLNNGSTWTTIPSENANIPGLLPGTNVSSLTQVKLRLTMTVSSAAAHFEIQGLMFYVFGGYSSTGTRISPALSLASAVRAGSTLVSWNATTDAGTSVTVETSPTGSGSWSSATNGGAITGITTQTTPILDTFSTNTSTSYTSTARTGGVSGTWTYDTSNSRITIANGTDAIYLRNSFSRADVDLMIDMDRAELAGLVWRWTDASNFYEVEVADSQAASNANTLRLYKVVANTKTQISTTQTISFTRGTPHRTRIVAVGTSIKVYFDGSLKIDTTDGSLTSAGQVGMLNGTGTAYFYNVRIMASGEDLTGDNVYTRVTLTSTNPLVSPRLEDLTTFVAGPSLGVGSLIPSADWRRTYVDANISDAGERSDYTWHVSPTKELIFGPRTLTPAPWILHSNDIEDVGMSCENSGHEYANRIVLKGVIDTVAFTDTKIGDGATRSWSLPYPLASAPTITQGGLIKTVGQKGVDTGKDYYWQYNDANIYQPSDATLLQSTDSFTVSGDGLYETSIVANNTSLPGTTTQAQYAAIAGGTGIVERIEDVSGKRINLAAATAYANTLLQRYGVIGRTLTFETRRDGLEAGQYLSAFVAAHNLFDAALLITGVEIIPRVVIESGSPVIKYTYRVEATEGPNLKSWAQLFAPALQ